MISQDQLGSLVGTTAYDRDGDKVGKVGAVYFDDATDEPRWVTVNTGLFGTKETFVPVQGAEFGGDRVTLSYDKGTLKNAPSIDEDGHLSPEEEQELYRYYSVDYAGAGDAAGRHTEERSGRSGVAGGVAGGVATGVAGGRGLRDDREQGYTERTDRDATVGRDTSGPTTDDAMTRSEEQLRVGTETRESGRARLRKHVVTERQETTVPVSHEEVTLERETITDANRGDAYDGPAISEEEHEVTLHAERPVVDTETVAVERVKMGKQTVTEQETVGGEVRKEQIDLDEGGRLGRDRRDDDRR